MTAEEEEGTRLLSSPSSIGVTEIPEDDVHRQ